MALLVKDGDYVSDGHGGFESVRDADALMQRVLLRLTAHRGAFPFLENFGSRLWKLGSVPAARRQSAAEQAVAEALADETELSVEEVVLSGAADGALALTVRLNYRGSDLSVGMTVQ